MLESMLQELPHVRMHTYGMNNPFRYLDPSGYANKAVETVGMSLGGQSVGVPVASGPSANDSTVNLRNDPSKTRSEVNHTAAKDSGQTSSNVGNIEAHQNSPQGELSHSRRVREEFEIIVVTEIRAPDRQQGMKSKQLAVVDRKSGKLIEKSVETGVTKLAWKGFSMEFGSRGDDFLVNSRKTADSLVVNVAGETASKLFPFMINYNLELRLDRNSGDWSVTGTHDGYPSYVVMADGAVIYDYQQGHVGELAGSGDVEVAQ